MRIGISLVDMVCGLYASNAIASALRHKERHWRGPLYRSLAAGMRPQHARQFRRAVPDDRHRANAVGQHQSGRPASRRLRGIRRPVHDHHRERPAIRAAVHRRCRATRAGGPIRALPPRTDRVANTAALHEILGDIFANAAAGGMDHGGCGKAACRAGRSRRWRSARQRTRQGPRRHSAGPPYGDGKLSGDHDASTLPSIRKR